MTARRNVGVDSILRHTIEIKEPTFEVENGVQHIYESEFQNIADVLNRLIRHRIALLSSYNPDGIEVASTNTLLKIVEKPRRSSELAHITFYDPSTITRQVNQLISKNLVEKQPDDTDKRATILVATPQGVELANEVRKIRNDYYALVFKGWCNNDRRRFITLLDRFVMDSEKLSTSLIY